MAKKQATKAPKNAKAAGSAEKKPKVKRYATKFGEHYSIVMIPTVTEVVNGIAVTRRGKQIIFERGIYETSDPAVQEFLDTHPRYGTNFKEVSKNVDSALHAQTLVEKEAELAAKEEELRQREMALKGKEEGADVASTKAKSGKKKEPKF